MKFLVTGGAGFIGSHLVDKLVEMGDVTVYDNLSSGRKEFIEHHIGHKGFRFYQADLLDIEKLKEAIQGQQIVFHLAANPDIRQGIKRTNQDLEQGTVATYNVLEAMKQEKVKKIVFASSSAVYGETPIKPISEDHGPLFPISLYGASKLACEGLISAFCHIFDMQAWIFRFANVVGERTTHGVIFDFIRKLRLNPEELEILGDGNQEKPYIYVDDCIDGIIHGFQYSNERINVFNLGSISTTKVSSIAEMLVSEMGLTRTKFRYTGGDRGWPGDVPQVRFCTTKMEKLNWKPKYCSDEAIRTTIKIIGGKLG
jgi:UDP-glucose 4-epimerase